ncbi:hypothetical protein DRE_01484 [Drechslerella stenobrocha 248]|uniref:Uncharacterized protein n=1 Tax=Drechslerella stenobrocha 248 TaxID=1043628 RepID=W7HU49_9PEZI|nr:hypothetical protein DRE_01484 [Drechslerella stenobrocha 248]
MASIAKPVPAVVPAVVAVEDASARPLTAIVDIASSPSNNLTTPADDGPRSIAHSQHEIDLISRIRDESDEYVEPHRELAFWNAADISIHPSRNTYSASGSLFPGDGAQNHGHSQLWNGDNGDYRLQAADLSNGSSFVDQAISISTPFAVDVDLDMDDIATTPTAWDAQHPLAALFNPPGPDPIQRSYTAPATSAFPLTLAERRLQLRNSHFRATPMASSIKPEDTQVKGLSRAANALRTKNFQSLGRASTVSSRLSDLTASDTDELLSSARKPTSNFGSMPSIHASLRHRKSPSMEQAGYIDHLERQISDMSIKLRSYTDPTSEKSHAAIVQRLNAKVRSLENQVSEWEALFDERIRETELVNSRERSSHASQVKSLRDQIEALNHTITNMEEDLDFERKQNTALTLAVTEKKALAMDNAQLAQALTKALGEIAELEAVAQEQEEMMYNNQQQGTLGALMIDVTPKPRSLETFSELNNNNNLLGISMRTNTTTPDVAKTGTAMLYSPTDAAWQTLSPTTSNASTPDMPLKRKMRKFPPGMPGPQQLILSPTHSRRSSGEFLTRGHSRNVSSSRGSPSMEKMAGRHNSLFAELERLQEDGMVTAINDETLSMVGSLAPAEASDAEQQATQQGHSTSPTDTETSDSEDSPKSDPTSPTQSSPSTTASPASSMCSSRRSG